MDISYNAAEILEKLNLYAVSINGNTSYDYDVYYRLKTKINSFTSTSNSSNRFVNRIDYTFENVSGKTSSRVETYTSTVNNGTAATYTYTYDSNGNITKISFGNGEEYRYVYDDLGQLIREDNSVTDRTYTYLYDDAGNIMIKSTHDLTPEGQTPNTYRNNQYYSYSDTIWGDRITNSDGYDVTYDAIGNPLTYFNGSSYTFTWQNGRELKKTVYKGSTILYKYNSEGIRTSKTVDTVEHLYRLNGTQIVSESWSNILVVYLYDAEGSPIGMQYRTSDLAEDVFYTFWFEKNLQGDIVAVYNEIGTKLISYSYDAWGNCTETLLNISGTNNYARNNPFRYRGYYLDTDTGLYYLQTRYYDPEIGRFINIDGQFNGGLVGNNLYSYCENDPVNYFDPNGEFAVSAIVIGTIIGLAIGFGATAYVDYADDGKVFNGSVSAEGYVVNTIVGAFTGGVGSSTFTFSIPSLALLETTIGTLELVVVGTTTITVNGLLVAGAGIIGISGVGSIMYSRANSGRIRFQDGTGIDPDTGKPVTDKERAREIYRSLTDVEQKNNWKKWMKGKGWRLSHLDK